MRARTYFEQVPLEEVKKIAGIELDSPEMVDEIPSSAEAPSRVLVIHAFDIFRIQADGEALWLDTAASVEEGRKRIDELRTTAPGQYFIFNQKTREKVW